MSQKGSALTALFDAFGHQRPQKDDLGTTRKFVEKQISPFGAKVRKTAPKGSEYLVLVASIFRPFSHLGSRWGPKVPPDAPGGGFERIWASFSTVFLTLAICEDITNPQKVED